MRFGVKGFEAFGRLTTWLEGVSGLVLKRLGQNGIWGEGETSR